MKIFIDDFGTFATAMGIVAAEAGNDVTFRVKTYDYPHLELFLSLLRTGKNRCGKRENDLHLEGIELPEKIRFTDDYFPALSADIIFIAVPSKFLNANSLALLPVLKINSKVVVVLLTKGLDAESKLPCALKLKRDLEYALGFKNFAVLSGYTPAEDLAISNLTKKNYAASVASMNLTAIKKVRQVFRGSRLGIVGTTDVAGVGAAGALKNAYAPGYGILLSLNEPELAWKFLELVHEEMKIFLRHFGADPKTWSSPALKGDFYLSCQGEVNWESRNVAFGKLLATYPAKEKIEEFISKRTVEGYDAMNVLWQIGQNQGFHLPLLYSLYRIAHGGYYLLLTDIVKKLSGKQN